MKNRISVILVLASMILYQNAISQDHVITFRPDHVQGIDAMIRTDYPDQNFGSEKDFMANAWTAGDFFVQRSLLKFDLSAIPADAQIKDAKLSLWCNIYTHHYQIDSGDNVSYLQRITSAWQENTVTWNTQPSVTSNDQVQLARSISNTQDYLDIDVTTLTKEMFANQNLNYGFMLRLVTEELYRCIVFASSDCLDPAIWPQLVVTYDQCSLPKAGFSYKSNYKQVQFNDSSSNATSWLWDFGDGQTSNMQNPIHTYAAGGDYKVCQQVYNECGQDNFCDSISVCREPVSQFTYAHQNELTIAFTNQSLFSDSLIWDFGDGQISYEQNPVHTYSQIGTYSVCLHATSVCGHDNYCDSISFCQEPVSNFSYSDNNNLTVAFTNESFLSDSLIWNFGDDQISYEQNPIHTYSQEGDYNVCLKAINDCGENLYCSVINICREPISGFYYYNYNYLIINFVDTSSNAESWYWDFGDGSSSTVQNPAHVYSHSSTYRVCLSVTNTCGQSVLCDSIFVLFPTQSCFSSAINDLTVKFTNLMDELENIEWNFGDGQSSTLRNPVHAYNEYGIYEVRLSGKKNNVIFVDRDTLELLNRDPLIGTMTKIKIFQNPSDGLFSIGLYNFLSSENASIHLKISNSRGSSAISEENYLIKSDNEILTVNLRNFESGMYFIQIRSQNGYWTDKVVIDKK